MAAGPHAAFALFYEFPLTGGGKIDRTSLAALASPDAVDARGPRTGRPSTPAEKKVSPVFEEVLGFAIGPNDHFFAVGGDSLQVARIRHREFRWSAGLV
nr:phosphopantetheine-binding protein [Streptomyces sp. NBC_01001]